MLKLQLATAATLLVLSGCAAVERIEARDSESMLAEAGFTRQAPSAAQGASSSASALPVRQLTRASANDAASYAFYDPDFCRCVYVGGPNEYARLEELRKQRLADHAWYMRSSNPITAAPDPQTWSSWNPEGLDVR